MAHSGSDAASHVTMSFGVSACVPDSSHTADHLIEAADAALYRAKSEGRNRAAWQPGRRAPIDVYAASRSTTPRA